ncbi:MAG TPA: hypothetical protein VK566_10355 [Nitrososphaeraceae archaeon]|nr:hypothetical protein [Nitrososphaeraceae archaeon]
MLEKTLKNIEPFTSSSEKNSRFCIGCGELATIDDTDTVHFIETCYCLEGVLRKMPDALCREAIRTPT